MAQTYTAEVEGVRQLTHDVRQLTLRLVAPPAIEFKPGQFISFAVPWPGHARPVIRPYSIASPPSRGDQIELILNFVPGGPGSNYLFSLQKGDQTSFTGPAGSFHLREGAGRERLFVATGTGIAPIRSMLMALHERRSPDTGRSLLIWGLRSQRDLYLQEELEWLSRQLPAFRYIVTLSRPEPGWSGPTGRVTPLVASEVPTVRNLEAYLCGNGGMIQDVTAVLNGKGLCPIYREKYYDDRP